MADLLGPDVEVTGAYVLPQTSASSGRPCQQAITEGEPYPAAELVAVSPAGQAAPRVVVRATVVMGDVKVLGDSSAELARRTLRAWLTGDDRDRRAIE